MQFNFLVMLAICAIVTARPQNNSSLDIEKDVSSTTTTVKPESKVIKIESSQDLKTNIAGAGDKLVVIFFSASWCRFSRRILPTVKDIADTMDVVVLEVDVDNNESIANEYDVASMPTFVFLKKSVNLKKYAGSNSEELRNNTRVFM